MKVKDFQQIYKKEQGKLKSFFCSDELLRAKIAAKPCAYLLSDGR